MAKKFVTGGFKGRMEWQKAAEQRGFAIINDKGMARFGDPKWQGLAATLPGIHDSGR
jgi:hypothetical protein